MKRIDWAIAGLVVVAIVWLGICTIHAFVWPLNGSTDGRQHTCGYMTDAGVTDHLAEYHARCGNG